MKLVQAVRKLRTNAISGFNLTTDVYDLFDFQVILETSQRWISERPSFSSRRVMLSEDKVPDGYRVLLIGDNDIPYIIYSEQKNVHLDKSFIYDYTLLDQTDIAEVIEMQGVAAASGQLTNTVEAVLYTTPIHLSRFGSTESKEHADADFSRMVAFIPDNRDIDTDNEIKVGTTYYQVDEVVKELYCTRIHLLKR